MAHTHSSPHTYKPAKTYGVFCPHCDPCPTCGAGPRPENSASAPVEAVPAPRTDDRDRILPAIPFSILFTLFLLEAHVQGGWRALIIPYVSVISCSRSVPRTAATLSSVDELADLMTGITLTDPGPNVREQPSKLFSTRDEFQDMRAASIPTSFDPVPFSVAQDSINAVLRSESRYPGMSSLIRNEDLLRAIRDRNDHHHSMHLAVDAATQIVLSEAPRLRTVKTSKAEGLALLRDEVYEELRELDQRVEVLGALLPKEDTLTETAPLRYDAAHIHANPVERLSTVAQMMVLLAVMIIRLVMSMSLAPDDEEYNPHQTHTLQQLPKNLRAALDTLKLDSKTTVYAACPACHFTHAPKEDRVTGDRPEAVLEPLLEDRNGKSRPIKPFLYVSFKDHLARLLADPKIEEMCDRACDVAMASLGEPAPEHVHNVFEADFLRTFQGPGTEKLFIDRGERMRLALEVQLDFFNPHGTSKRGHTIQTGVHVVQHNPGKKEPNVDEINHYQRPLVDELVLGWERGIHISPIGSSSSGQASLSDQDGPSPSGRDVDFAMVISVNDLPAAVKCQAVPASGRISIARSANVLVSGLRIARTWIIQIGCTEITTSYGRRHLLIEMRGHRGSGTQSSTSMVFAGQNWRLTYWNPTRMLVIDGMHCVLEGLVHYHCRKVLRIDAAIAQKKERGPVAFEQEWPVYDPNDVHPDYLLQSTRDQKQVFLIQSKLVAPFDLEESEEPVDEPPVDEDQEMPPVQDGAALSGAISDEVEKMRKALMSKNAAALRFVAHSLDLDLTGLIRKTHFTERLIEWRLTQPLGSFEHVWAPYDTEQVDASYRLRNPQTEIAQVPKIQSILTRSSLPGPARWYPMQLLIPTRVPITTPKPDPKIEKAAAALTNSLKSYNRKPNWAAKLTAWRLTKPFSNPHYVSRAIDLTKLKFIQRVIATTATPSWIHSIGFPKRASPRKDPKNFVSEQCSTTLWLYFKPSCWLVGLPVTLDRVRAYRQFIKEWVDGINKHHPHTTDHARRTNIHAAFHIYDFLLLFGPIISWWCFPFERLIGVLQKITTNDQIGGELEATITTSFTRSANLRRWLNRPDCPAVIKEFKTLFDHAYTPRWNATEESAPLVKDGERAHYTFRGVNYSRESTHLGNSLVLYSPSAGAEPIAGSIQKIVTDRKGTVFTVQRQAPLPADAFDPFLRYPHFPAKSYSSDMEDTFDTISPSAVLSHCARFDYSNNRSVILICRG
ncbi:hypothetical protein B0H13DRAFT_2378458 [Mycena leptocephala]|nr:hypothetical protein B0H13DRAFT_2378458 [Mycena leptocephala]